MSSPRYTPELNQLRKRLRGVAQPVLLSTLQEQLEKLAVAALAADNTGRYVAANSRAAALTGYSQAELLTMNVKDVTPSIRHEASETLWNRFIQTGTQTGEYVLERKNGSPVTVHYTAYASIVPGVHLSLLTEVELPSSI